MAISRDQKVLISYHWDNIHDSGAVTAWNFEKGAKTASFNALTERIGCMAVSADAKWIATGSISMVHVWDASKRKEIAKFKTGDVGNLHALAFSPDGATLMTGDGYGIGLWDRATGSKKRLFKNNVDCLCFLPDGKSVAVGNDGSIQLFDVTSGELKRTFGDHKHDISCLAPSPDGQKLVAGTLGDDPSAIGELKLWSVATGKLITEIKGHSTGRRVAAFSPDGKYVVSAGGNPSGADIRIWDIGAGKEVVSFQGTNTFVNALIFSPDGKSLITGDNLGKIKLWDFAQLLTP